LYDFGILFQFYCVSNYYTRAMNYPVSVSQLFSLPPKTPCTLQNGIYEIRSHESSSGYLFKLMKISNGEGIYSISAPVSDELPQSYTSTPIGTPEILSTLISHGFCIIEGPSIDVGTTLISIEHIQGSMYYKLICDVSPAGAAGGRGSYKQLIHPRSCRRGRRCRRSRRRSRSRSRRSRSRSRRKN